MYKFKRTIVYVPYHSSHQDWAGNSKMRKKKLTHRITQSFLIMIFVSET